VRRRIVEQNQKVEELTILVLGKQLFDQMVAPNVRVVSTASWFRFFYIFDAWHRLWVWRKEEFDVVTTDTVETALVGAFAARIFMAVWAVQDHGYYFHGDYYRKESFTNRFLYLFMRWAVKRAEAVRVVSQRTESAVIKLGVSPDKIVRFPLAVTSNVQRITYDVAENIGSYFLLVARFVPIKRIDLAIHAFSLIANSHPELKLVIQGRGPLEGQIRKKIQEFGLEDRIEIRPWEENLSESYSNALATLITSDREGFGMTAVESLTCGTPVIMTDVGCAGEVVKDGENGYVVPVGDVDALADRMERVILDSAMLREKARGYSWTNDGPGMFDLYQKALANRHK
jgi:glycosyltransferase involved in cell wall biosynthesis